MEPEKEYPLYPELTEQAQKEAQLVMDSFKAEFLKIAEDALSELYFNVVTHIESDSWTNFRNTLMDGLCDYSNRNAQSDALYDFRSIRQAIYKEYRDEIVVDLNQDLVEENERLKSHIEDLKKWELR